MKLVSLNCPNCNAKQEINDEFDYCTCNYCGTKFYVEKNRQMFSFEAKDAREFGYNMEKGINDARNDGAEEELISKIYDILITIVKLDGLYKELQETESDLNNLKNIINGKRSVGGLISAFVIPFGILLFILLCSSLGGNIGIIILMVLVFVASIPICWITHNKQTDVLYSKFQIKKGNRRELLAEIVEIEEQSDFSAVPEDYCNTEALNYIYKVLRNKRAMNLQQAINMYEDKKHQDEVMNLKRQQIELHQQQLEIQRRQEEKQQEQIEIQRMQLKEQERISKNTKSGSNMQKVIAAGTVISTGVKLYKTFLKNK